MYPHIGTWIEPFGGTFAVGLRLAHVKGRPPCTYQGGKMTVANATLRAAGYSPGQGAARYWYNEGDRTVWAGMDALRLADPDRLRDLILALPEGRAGYDQVLANPVRDPHQEDRTAWAAQFWALQACSVQGKPPKWTLRGWKTSGYASVSPSGIRRGFRERLNPKALAPKLEATRSLLEGMDFFPTLGDAAQCIGGPGDVAYLDPNYRKTTGYRCGISREDAKALALCLRRGGARVLYAESEPVDLPGARHVQLKRSDGRPLPRNREEWLTILGPGELSP
jgi:hypothetical protein